MIEVKTYPEPKLNRKEILRYAGCGKESGEMSALLDECLLEAYPELSYRVCFCEVPIRIEGELVDFSVMQVKSKLLAQNLSGCERAVIFAATVGVGIDRLVQKYSKISPSKALIMQAIGAERIESLCDMFESDMKNSLIRKGLFTRPRFSPGYGDFHISKQQDIFNILDCPRKIGLTLNESLIMSPSKSVTAVMGISKTSKNCDCGCEVCQKTDCEFRRENR